MSMDIGGAMDGLATAFATVPGITKAYGYPNEGVAAGQAVVGYPETVDITLTFGSGSARTDHAVFPVWVICGLPMDLSTRDAVSALLTNADDVATKVDGNLGGAVDSCRVLSCAIERIEPIGRPQQVAVRFDVDVIA